MLASCRRRRHHGNKPVGYWNNRRQQQHCLRNPLVVFCLSFFALGSLRFRVRTKQAAQNLIQRGRKRMSLRSATPQIVGQNGNVMTTTSRNDPFESRTIAYELVEGGKSKKAPLQRYRAVWVERNDLRSRWRKRFGSASSKQPAVVKSSPVSVEEWTRAMLLSSSLLDQFIQILQSGNSYQAYFFETKGVNGQNAHEKPFEFVLVDAPQLQAFVEQSALSSNSEQPFQDKFQQCASRIVNGKVMNPYACQFPSLGGDAVLVAPRPVNPQASYYGHLASFVRFAPPSQVREFWVLVLRVYLERMALPLQLPSGDNASDAAPVDAANPESLLHNEKKQLLLPLRAHNMTAAARQADNDAAARHGSSRPVWLSTDGTGVPWLHMRLDETPKYYSYAPFAKEH